MSRIPLRIHVWGGLGSQIHAWFLLERLKTDFPERKVLLVFHSSGVTRRLPEISNFFLESGFEFVDDFSASENSMGSKIKSGLKEQIKINFLMKFHLIESSNNEDEYRRIRWWTTQTRGHYSRLALGQELTHLIFSKLSGLRSDSSIESRPSNQLISIHLRLGDLLQIQEKSPTNKEGVRRVVADVISQTKLHDLLVFSDSPEVAFQWLQGFNGVKLANEELQLSAIKSMISMIESEVFIGTGSKISIWVGLFRVFLAPLKQTYLPFNLKPIIDDIIPETVGLENLKFYDSVDD